MRSIGSFFFLILFILVGFGFLLSDNLNVRKELATANDQIALANQQLQAMQEQYNTVFNENRKLEDQVAPLTQENGALKQKIQGLEEENAAARKLNSELQAEVDFFQATAPVLARLKIASSNLAAFTILAPLFPISLGTVWILVARSTKGTTRKNRNNTGRLGRSMLIKVTEEEMRRLVEIRRGK